MQSSEDIMSHCLTEGGCLCGAIRYGPRGAPTVSMICHCCTCRRAAGSPTVAWLTCSAENFSWMRGKPAAFASSPAVVRTFCASCGTPLTYTHAERPSEVDVTTCTLDNPEAFPPTYHAWVSHALAWVRCGDALTAYHAAKEG